jgi:hypothetical protein
VSFRNRVWFVREEDLKSQSSQRTAAEDAEAGKLLGDRQADKQPIPKRELASFQ